MSWRYDPDPAPLRFWQGITKAAGLWVLLPWVLMAVLIYTGWSA